MTTGKVQMGSPQNRVVSFFCPVEGATSILFFVLDEFLILTDHSNQFGIRKTMVVGRNHGITSNEIFFSFIIPQQRKKSRENSEKFRRDTSK
jgi:hypothetical protein